MTRFPPIRRAAFRRSALGRALLWTLAPAVALASLRFAVLPIEQAAPHFAHHVAERAPAFYGHVLIAALALALTPVQLSARIRARRPGLHRWAGRVCAGAMGLSGVAGLALALNTDAGPVAMAGFVGLAVLWLGTTAAGVAAALRRDLQAHRRWMIRAAALTLAAVTLRLQLGAAMGAGLEFAHAYQVIAWACWVPNLLVAEALLRRPTRPAPAGLRA